MWDLEGRRDGGPWVRVPEEPRPNEHAARQRMDVFARLIPDSEWRIVKRKDSGS